MDEWTDGWMEGWGIWKSGQLEVEWLNKWIGAWRDVSLEKSSLHTYENPSSSLPLPV